MSDEGGEDSPPRPKRRIKKVMVLSSGSSSDSEDSIVATGARRKRLRVLSEEDVSDSSGSSVVMAGARRRRVLPQLRDSDAESASSGSASDVSPARPTTSTAAGFASDSSEGNSDKCSICLLRFTSQEVGTPHNCEHIFCLDCITEWSKNMNTCPVDRITFDSIVVRSCAGGRILRSEPVKVVERRPSVEMLVVEDPTVCEVCGRIDNEEQMLLCDGCDLGYHMQCLTPPINEIPMEQWLCPNCDDLLGVIHVSELDQLFRDMEDMDFELPMSPRPSVLREARNVRRSVRRAAVDQPSTSRGPGPSPAAAPAPGPSSRRRPARPTRPTRPTAHRTRKRRKARTVIVEYEVEEGGKFPVTKTIKKKIRKKKVRRRQPRTAARRALVQRSVRARLAAAPAGPPGAPGPRAAAPGPGPAPLALARRRAGIPSLSLFGDHNQLEYFSEDEHEVSEGATTAVAARPTSTILSAYRQARRKMISIPSPPPASAAPDVLSSILESQSLLHGRGPGARLGAPTLPGPRLGGPTSPETKLRASTLPGQRPQSTALSKDRVDVTKVEDATRKVPAYPGQSRGGGGWGGGWTGSWSGGGPREGPRGALPGAPGGPPRGAPGPLGLRRDQPVEYNAFPRRPYYPEDHLDRRRHSDHGRPGPPLGPPRHTPGPGWLPPGRREPPQHHRHSFSGFENPLDMRVGSGAPAEVPRRDRPPALPFQPLPQPPVFNFQRAPDVDKSEDDEERSDPGLVIDTEKYDPTEPTNDDDSGDEEQTILGPVQAPMEARVAQQAVEAPVQVKVGAPLEPAAEAPLQLVGGAPVQAVVAAVAGLVLQQRRLQPQHAPSDDDDDGDCPNFSIYSATSVHIANNPGHLGTEPPTPKEQPPDDMTDLVQEDDDSPPHTPQPPTPPPLPAPPKKRPEDEYKEKVSKRCPITTSTRNPIKIKLNPPSLIKRPISLYDEDSVEDATLEPAPTPSVTVNNNINNSIPSSHLRESHQVKNKSSSPEVKVDSAKIEDNDKESGDTTPQYDLVPGTTDKEALRADSASPAERGEDETPAEGVADSPPAKVDAETGAVREGAEVPVGEEGLEKMTESISETEDERSYTPCLDENKDASIDTDKEKGIEGLDTEMISEDEGNEMFSDGSAASGPGAGPAGDPGASGAPAPAEDGELPARSPEPRRKKKKEGKERKNKPKKAEVGFKKLSKSGKERNYRDRDKDKDKDKGEKAEKTDKEEKEKGEKRKRSRRESGDARLRRARRKDLARYDVRCVLTERRAGLKDSFGRDISPRARSRSPSVSRSRSPGPARSPARRRSPSRDPVRRRSTSPRRRSGSPGRMRSGSPPPRRTTSPLRRRSVSPLRRRSVSPLRRRSVSPLRRRSGSPLRRRSGSPVRRRSGSPGRRTSGGTPRASPSPRRRRPRPPERRRRASVRKRRRSPSKSRSPKPKTKKKKRPRVERSPSGRRKSPRRRRAPSWSPAPAPCAPPAPAPAPRSSPRTPPAAPARAPRPLRSTVGPAKEVFTSGDNILVSVSFEEPQRSGAAARRSRRRRSRRRRAAPPSAAPKPVAIIDLERSPFREITPSPKHVIVLSDSDPGEKECSGSGAPEAGAGPKTPPSPPGAPEAPEDSRGPATPPDPPSSPDAYDPFEPTHSPSPSPSPAAPPPSPPRPSITLEAAQKTNMSADDVIDRRPISPMEKVLALLQSTRDVSPDPPPGDPPAGEAAPPPPAAPSPSPAPAEPSAPAPAPAPLPRIVLPSPTRSAPPKLFLAKPSPIKSDPIKPMPATKLPRPPARRSPPSGGDSPYSPGSSDFGDLFEPPAQLTDKPRKRNKSAVAKVPVKYNRKKGKTQVGVKIDEDNLKILDDLPSSAVEMQVKSKFLKKLNRQERVVEEVKLVLKPHYNKKHVTKDEYKDILRRTVPKICHNKTGEINPTKIQALVEAYVKKFRKKHKLGLA